jgi:hypothetical protein
MDKQQVWEDAIGWMGWNGSAQIPFEKCASPGPHFEFPKHMID